MTLVTVLGGAVYDNPAFINLMNANYADQAAMERSVAKLKASNLIDLETMQFGQYQPILSDTSRWPNDGGRRWLREMGGARIDLMEQPNGTPLSNDERSVVPLTKCGLLDACVRKCFNSTPPIPITIYVTQQKHDAPDSKRHDILLDWEYGNGQTNAPTRLHLTMVCPALGPLKV